MRSAPAARSGDAAPPSQLRQSYDVLVHPDRAVPGLFHHQGTLSLIGFPAVSGMFVAYLLARGLGLGDRFGFWPTLTGVIIGGALLGLIALWFAGSLPGWSLLSADAEEAEASHMLAIFSETTWPFLPALLVIAGLELSHYGTAIFSAERGDAPALVFWGAHALVLLAIGLWLFMTVRATAVARHETTGQAAGELRRWGADLLVIAVLFALILMASVMYW